MPDLEVDRDLYRLRVVDALGHLPATTAVVQGFALARQRRTRLLRVTQEEGDVRTRGDELLPHEHQELSDLIFRLTALEFRLKRLPALSEYVLEIFEHGFKIQRKSPHWKEPVRARSLLVRQPS